MKGGLAGRGSHSDHGTISDQEIFEAFFFGECVSYPHALHSRHGPEGPEGPQGSHCPEGLDPTSAKQGGSEVDERDLGLLVG